MSGRGECEKPIVVGDGFMSNKVLSGVGALPYRLITTLGGNVFAVAGYEKLLG